MPVDSGYFYANAGGVWPSVNLGPTMQVGSAGIGLKPAGSGFATSGSFLAGPFQVSDLPTAWFRVLATMIGTPAFANSHVQFFTYTAAAGPAPWNPASPAPFADPSWKSAPRDALDFTIQNAPGLVLFVGALFRGDGTESLGLDQIRIEYGRDTYAKFLPPVYRQQPAAADFLARFLGIPQSVLSGIEEEIEDLPRLFDPKASPAGDPPSWLGWLSGWLTFIQDEHWAIPDARKNLANAFHLYGKRGTIEGLREYLKIYAGVNALIEEPARAVHMWALGEPNLLGFATMLAPGPLDGAVLGTTATVDQSHMTTGQDFGAALFEDVAHRFCVSVYCSELTSTDTLSKVQEVIDREKPAHTTYQLCVIEPALRVGVQARLGIDAIVGKEGHPQAAIGLPLGTATLAQKADACAPGIN
jgi:phage tail-like protein